MSRRKHEHAYKRVPPVVTPVGHPVPMTAASCPVCGADLTVRSERFMPCLSEGAQHRYRDEDVDAIADAIRAEGGVVIVSKITDDPTEWTHWKCEPCRHWNEVADESCCKCGAPRLA